MNENIEEKINLLIKSHTRVDEVTVSAARRLSSNADGKPGVVIVTFSTKEDKEKVMKSKNSLKDTVYKQVFIHNDQPKEERLLNSNLRAIVDAVNHGNANLSVRGNRIVRNNNRDLIREQNAGGSGNSFPRENQNTPSDNGTSRGRGFGRGNGYFRGNRGSRGGSNGYRGGNNAARNDSNGSQGSYNGNRGGGNGLRGSNNGSRRGQRR